MTGTFPLRDENMAPETARETLAAVRQNFGMVPNLERVMANAPALLAAYAAASELFDTTSLTPIEREVVCQTANFENECDYCVPWHTYLSIKAKMTPPDVEALRAGGRLGDPKLEALRVFARQLIQNRGKIARADLAAFFEAGYGDRAALEVVLGLALKAMSNYTNSIAGTPLDEAVKKYAWEKPRIAMRAPAGTP